jgi:hypothetical protein
MSETRTIPERRRFMKRLLCVLVVLAGGCNSGQVAVPLEREGPTIEKPLAGYQQQSTEDGYVVSFVYEGKRHVFFVVYHGRMSKIGEYPVGGIK